MKINVFIGTWLVLFVAYFLTGDSSLPIQILFKLLPDVVILAALVANRPNIDRRTLTCVFMALVLSMLGDTAGEFKDGKIYQIAFIIQILFFVGAQFCYTASFIHHIRRGSKPTKCNVVGKAAALLVIYVYLAMVALQVFSKLQGPALIIACSIYLFALFSTGTTSVLQNREYQYFYIFGAMLFIFSDSIIAISSFVTKVPYDGYIIMSTYFIAQLLLNVKLVSYSPKA